MPEVAWIAAPKEVQEKKEVCPLDRELKLKSVNVCNNKLRTIAK